MLCVKAYPIYLICLYEPKLQIKLKQLRAFSHVGSCISKLLNWLKEAKARLIFLTTAQKAETLLQRNNERH